jgi:glutaredoxin 3
MGAEVVVYTTEYCAYCVRVKALLSKKAVPFAEIDVGERGDLRSWLAQASGQRTVPQVFINGQSVGGFTDVADLERKGALDPLLARSPEAGDPEVRR